MTSYMVPLPHERAVTPLERDVANRLFLGLGNKEIAWQLGITESAVKNRMAKILRKSGMGSKLELITFLAHHPEFLD